jgi:tellurite resistance protein
LHGQTPARLVLAAGRGDGFLDAQERSVVQRPAHLLGLAVVLLQ